MQPIIFIKYVSFIISRVICECASLSTSVMRILLKCIHFNGHYVAICIALNGPCQVRPNQNRIFVINNEDIVCFCSVFFLSRNINMVCESSVRSVWCTKRYFVWITIIINYKKTDFAHDNLEDCKWFLYKQCILCWTEYAIQLKIKKGGKRIS